MWSRSVRLVLLRTSPSLILHHVLPSSYADISSGFNSGLVVNPDAPISFSCPAMLLEWLAPLLALSGHGQSNDILNHPHLA